MIDSFLFSNRTSGDWSNHGVKMTSSEGNKIECESDHLTNFAVLMQVKKFEVCKGTSKTIKSCLTGYLCRVWLLSGIPVVLVTKIVLVCLFVVRFPKGIHRPSR